MANKLENLKPFKKGEDSRRHKKQKGEISFKTIFEKAARGIVDDLNLGKKPDVVQVEIVKKGINMILKKGNYQFYKDTMDRLYGQVKQDIDLKDERAVNQLLDELNGETNPRKQKEITE